MFYTFSFDLEKPFSKSTRSAIVDFILKRTAIAGEENEEEEDVGIDKCIEEGIYTAAYPLHEVKLQSYKKIK